MDGIRYGGDIRQWRQLTMATNGQARGRSKADQWREAPIANAPIATAASANDPIVYIPTVFAPTSFLRRAARTVGTNAGLGLLRCHSSMFNEPPNQCTDRGTNNNADCENRGNSESKTNGDANRIELSLTVRTAERTAYDERRVE